MRLTMPFILINNNRLFIPLPQSIRAITAICPLVQRSCKARQERAGILLWPARSFQSWQRIDESVSAVVNIAIAVVRVDRTGGRTDNGRAKRTESRPNAAVLLHSCNTRTSIVLVLVGNV